MPETDPAKLMTSAAAAEQRTRELLARGQWRKTRDEIKPLVKLDRVRYLPLLIQANIGLSREMQAKGQVAEAQQLLAYLASIASADELREAEAQLMGKNQGAATDLSKAAAALMAP